MIWTPERQRKALEEAASWRGTLHFDRLRIKGRGVDCINFAVAILEACEILPKFKLPFYVPSWGIGRTNNVMERLALECFHAEVVSDNEPYQFGDIAVFRVGRQSNHTGILLDGELWHCMTGRAVEPAPLNRAMMTGFQSVLRITETGLRRNPETLTVDDFKST